MCSPGVSIIGIKVLTVGSGEESAPPSSAPLELMFLSFTEWIRFVLSSNEWDLILTIACFEACVIIYMRSIRIVRLFCVIFADVRKLFVVCVFTDLLRGNLRISSGKTKFE